MREVPTLKKRNGLDMRISMILGRRCLLLTLALGLTLLTQGCGDGESFVALGAAPPSASQAVATTTGTFSLSGEGVQAQRISGTVWLDGPSPATVRLFLHNGEPRVEATLKSGHVMLADLSQPEVDSLVLGGKEGEGPFESGNWVWVTPVSTLLAVYRDLHPELSHTERLSRLKQHLEIGARESINRPFSSVPGSQFWPQRFLEAAGNQSLVDFSRQVIASLEGTRGQSIFDDPVEDDPGTPGPSRLMGFADNVGAGLVTDILWKALGFAVAKTFLGTSTRQQLDDINNQLQEISTQLSDISENLKGLGTGTLASSVSTNALAPLETYRTQEVAMLASTSYVPFSFGNANFLASSEVGQLTQPANVSNALLYAQTITGACLNIDPSSGLGNIPMGFTEGQAGAYGSGTATFTGGNPSFFYDFRNDVAVTGKIQQVTDYYIGYLGQAGNMLTESLTAALGTNLSSPASSIQQAQSYVNGSYLAQRTLGDSSANGIQALARRMQQQRPLALFGGQSPLAPVWAAPMVAETIAGTGSVNGTMWANCTEVTEANNNPQDAVYLETVGQFNVNGYYCWYLPSKAEVVALCQSAAQAAKADGIGPSDQQVPYGLHKLGLLSDANYKSGMTNVGIYFQLSSDKNHPACQVYESKDGSTDDGMYEAGLNAYGFSASKSNVRLLLLARSFPGLPQGAGGQQRNATAVGAASASGPDAVVNSNSAQQARAATGGQLLMWNSGIALAGNLPPTEIAVGRDSNSNQLRAYGIWLVSAPVTPSVYFNNDPTFTHLYKYYPAAGSFPSEYLVYTELTDSVEWLSSNTAAAEVSNYALAHVPTFGGKATGVSLGGPELIIEDPVLSTQGLTTRITGGKVLLARLIEPTGSFGPAPTLSGATNLALGTPLGDLDPSGATVTGGTITNGVPDSDDGLQSYTLLDSSGATLHTVAVGGSIRSATIENGYITLASGSADSGGVVSARNASLPATITASWLTSPSTSTQTNSKASSANFLTGSLALAAGSVFVPPSHRSLVVSPNYTKLQLKTGGQNLTLYTTAFNADGTCTDLSANSATRYSVFRQVGNDQTFQQVPSTLISFGGVDAGGQPVQPNVMKFQPDFNTYSGTLVVRAENGNDSGYSFLQVLAP